MNIANTPEGATTFYTLLLTADCRSFVALLLRTCCRPPTAYFYLSVFLQNIPGRKPEKDNFVKKKKWIG
jgi:hypothetical protein